VIIAFLAKCSSDSNLSCLFFYYYSLLLFEADTESTGESTSVKIENNLGKSKCTLIKFLYFGSLSKNSNV